MTVLNANDRDHLPVRDVADAALPLYKPDENCFKCASTFQSLHYVGARDIIAVTCSACGFAWERRPINDRQCDWKQQINAVTVKRCTLRVGHVIPHDFG